MKYIKSIVVIFVFIVFNTFSFLNLEAEEKNVKPSLQNLDKPQVEENNQTKPDDNKQNKDQNEQKDNNTPKTEQSNDVKDDNNDEKEKVSLKVKIPENLTDNKQQTQQLKIDDETVAKITISTKNNEKDNKQNEKQKEKSFLEKATDFIKNENSTSKQEIKEYKISKNADGQNKNNDTYVVIKDGDKNINIILQPNFQNCITCKNGVENKQKVQTKNTNKTTIAKSKKKQKSKKPTTKPIKNNEKKNEDKNFDIIQIQPVGSNSAGTTIRDIYENNLISCVGKKCDNEFNTTKQQPANTEKIIEKETKIIQQPVYVINRIVNLDEDMNISEEDINQILIKADGETENINDNNNKKIIKNNTASISKTKHYAKNNVDKFKQQYDIINQTEMSYGEVAFVDDYND